MPRYKLYYFDGRGRAELARLVLAAAGVEYEDIRFSREEWPQHKEDMPFGQVPVLEEEGKGKLSESAAIARYLAREHGLAGKDSYQQGLADEIMCVIEDLVTSSATVYREENEEAKEEKKRKLSEVTIPTVFGNLNSRASENTFTGEISVADLYFFVFVEMAQNFKFGADDEVLSGFPKLKSIIENVKKNPRIAEWLAKRPVTAF